MLVQFAKSFNPVTVVKLVQLLNVYCINLSADNPDRSTEVIEVPKKA